MTHEKAAQLSYYTTPLVQSMLRKIHVVVEEIEEDPEEQTLLYYGALWGVCTTLESGIRDHLGSAFVDFLRDQDPPPSDA